jgi:hypothetical protein
LFEYVLSYLYIDNLFLDLEGSTLINSSKLGGIHEYINEDTKNILFDKIYEHIKNTLFSDIYFKFEGSIRNLSLSNFIDSFHLGSAFIEVCETLELDVNKVKECILKYVFHQLYEESLKLSLEELQVLRDCYDESILNVQLEDILWKEYFHSPDHYMDYYEKPLLAMKYSASTEEYQLRKRRYLKSYLTIFLILSILQMI